MTNEDHLHQIIELVGVKRNRHLLSFIRHQLDRRIGRNAQYRVTITHDPEIRGYSCRIHVRSGGHEWSGYDTGKTLDACLERTLRHLHENSWPTREAQLERSA